MKKSVEMHRKRLAFLAILVLTVLGSLGLAWAVSLQNQPWDQPLAGSVRFLLQLLFLGAFALGFVWVYERVNDHRHPAKGGLIFGAVMWMITAFPIFLFLSAAGIHSVESYLWAGGGSLLLFLVNGLVTGLLMREVSVKALDDHSTDIG